MTSNTNRNAFLAGGGIASLAAAAFLIRDGRIPGPNITIFEESSVLGGSLDGSGQADKGYVIRGGRMFNFSYRCTYDLLSSIPSITNPRVSVHDEIVTFTKEHMTHSGARLVDKDGSIVDGRSMGFTEKDRIDLVGLMATPEALLGRKTIGDWFHEDFFHTNFWFMWSSMFAFEPWHSAVEFKRYLLRFIHEFPRIDTLAGVDRTPYNQYDSMVLPLVRWLETKGVRFVLSTRVVDLDVRITPVTKTVTAIHLLSHSRTETLPIDEDDLVFVTLGSMTANSNAGAMDRAPMLLADHKDGAWALWETLAERSPDFGRPENFNTRVDESKWESFTVTCRDPGFFQWMERFSGNKAGTGGLVTFKDSNWMLSIVLAHQPHFIDQPEDVTVFWGYGLFPDNKGNYVDKKMSECTGAEILTELLSHLHISGQLPLMLRTANCIPCMLPFITSEFLTRSKGDRPAVIPAGSTNLAFLGQFTEIEDDVVFTVEYSVRSAQLAVYTLLGLGIKPPALYKGQHDIKVLYNAIKTMHR